MRCLVHEQGHRQQQGIASCQKQDNEREEGGLSLVHTLR
jgi:hypothetical protein